MCNSWTKVHCKKWFHIYWTSKTHQGHKKNQRVEINKRTLNHAWCFWRRLLSDCASLRLSKRMGWRLCRHHNFQDPVQNENAGVLLKQQEKKGFYFFPSSSVSLIHHRDFYLLFNVSLPWVQEYGCEWRHSPRALTCPLTLLMGTRAWPWPSRTHQRTQNREAGRWRDLM